MNSLRDEITAIKQRIDDLTADEKVLVEQLDQALRSIDLAIEERIDGIFAEHESRRAQLATKLFDLSHRLGRAPTAHLKSVARPASAELLERRFGEDQTYRDATDISEIARSLKSVG